MIVFVVYREESQCTGESLVFVFDMPALKEHLRKQGEQSKTAYYTVEILKYQVIITVIISLFIRCKIMSFRTIQSMLTCTHTYKYTVRNLQP